MFSINFNKANTKFCFSLHCNADIFPTRVCLGSISDGFTATEFKEVSLNGIVYDFSVDYNSIDKSEISNIHKYLIIKNKNKYVIVKVFKMITNRNEAKTMSKHILCDSRCKFNSATFNSNQK